VITEVLARLLLVEPGHSPAEGSGGASPQTGVIASVEDEPALERDCEDHVACHLQLP